MPKALIVYATRTGETESIAQLIGEGLRMSGVETVVADVKDIRKESDLEGYDAYVFGAPTYHGDMLKAMKTFLFLAEKAQLEGRVGGAFGAFGWSGEAHERIFDTMKNIFKMKMVSGPLRLKASTLGGGLQMAQEYGREVAGAVAV
ncbi:MAG: flavodoxin domain-containing protein [Desulfobacteraceae bacterium]|jgi:flavorubredoxin|nr:flavodoxin domain-containing protein [Desulfobacteraceae bacterium]